MRTPDRVRFAHRDARALERLPEERRRRECRVRGRAAAVACRGRRRAPRAAATRRCRSPASSPAPTRTASNHDSSAITAPSTRRIPHAATSRRERGEVRRLERRVAVARAARGRRARRRPTSVPRPDDLGVEPVAGPEPRERRVGDRQLLVRGRARARAPRCARRRRRRCGGRPRARRCAPDRRAARRAHGRGAPTRVGVGGRWAGETRTRRISDGRETWAADAAKMGPAAHVAGPPAADTERAVDGRLPASPDRDPVASRCARACASSRRVPSSRTR